MAAAMKSSFLYIRLTELRKGGALASHVGQAGAFLQRRESWAIPVEGHLAVFSKTVSVQRL